MIFRRSIYVVKNVKKNEKISKKNIKIVRPAKGLEPKFYDQILNKKFKKNIKKNSPLGWAKIQ